MSEFNLTNWNDDTWNGPDLQIIPTFPPPATTVTAPLAPPPQQFTNASTLIDGGYKEAGILVFRNGVLLTAGLDYTRSGGVVDLVVPPIPGDIMTARVFVIGKQLGGATPERYVTPWTLRLTGKFDSVATVYNISFGPTIQGGCDGRNSVFSVSVTLQRIQLWRNGVLQTLGVDFAQAPTAVVFLPAAIPQPGDLLTILGYGA